MHSMLKYLGLLSLIVQIALGQSLNLNLTSASGTPGSTVVLNIQLTTSGVSPAALEWTVNAPAPDIQSITPSVGAAASGATKAIQCNGNTCVLYGLNANPIPSGTVAPLSVQLAPTVNGNLVVQLSNTSAASTSGGSVAVSTTDGIVSII